MNSTEFAYWLQGFLELREDDKPLTSKQVQIIKDHLALVFQKVTPDRKDDEPDVWPGDPSPTIKPFDYNPFDRPDVYCAPVTVTPPVVPEKPNLEEIIKKIQEKQLDDQKNVRTYCSSETPKKGVEYWSGRSGLTVGRPGTGRIC
jgi:hypothetical protein